PDLVRVVAGESPRLEVRLAAAGWKEKEEAGKTPLAAAGIEALAAAGLDNDGAEAAAILDYDMEGDLDLVLAGSAVEIFRNSLAGPLTASGTAIPPGLGLSGVRDLA